MKIAFLIPFASLALAGCQTTESSLTRTIVSGQTLQLDFISALNPDCSLIGESNFRLTSQPSLGQISVTRGSGFSSFPRENSRFKCNSRRSPGTIVTYRPNPGSAGTDTFTADLIFGTGRVITKRYTVNVR